MTLEPAAYPLAAAILCAEALHDIDRRDPVWGQYAEAMEDAVRRQRRATRRGDTLASDGLMEVDKTFLSHVVAYLRYQGREAVADDVKDALASIHRAIAAGELPRTVDGRIALAELKRWSTGLGAQPPAEAWEETVPRDTPTAPGVLELTAGLADYFNAADMDRPSGEDGPSNADGVGPDYSIRSSFRSPDSEQDVRFPSGEPEAIAATVAFMLEDPARKKEQGLPFLVERLEEFLPPIEAKRRAKELWRDVDTGMGGYRSRPRTKGLSAGRVQYREDS